MNIYDFLSQNTIYWIILLQFFIILSVIGLFISSILCLKTKKFYWIGAILVSLFGTYQIIPHFYEIKAVTAANDDIFVQNYQKAMRTSILPIQKVMMLDMLAGYYNSKNLPIAIEYYEKIYKYTKNYKSKCIWARAIITYYLSGDFDKVIEINNSLNINMLTANAYIMKKDFNNALISVNKQLNANPNSWNAFALRANIYKNLEKEKEAEQDYNKALTLCKYKNQVQDVKNYYQNKSAVQDDWELKRKTFIEKGGTV